MQGQCNVGTMKWHTVTAVSGVSCVCSAFSMTECLGFLLLFF